MKTRKLLVVHALLTIMLLCNTAIAGQSGDYTYIILTNPVTLQQEATITGYTGAGGAISIPSTVDTFPVVKVGDSSFTNNKTITSVTIEPPNIKTIGGAFVGCTNLTTVNLSDNVTSIKASAFYGCTSLSSINLDSVGIGLNAFFRCTSLTNLTLMSTRANVSIATNAFAESGLITVSLSAGVTGIGYRAFSRCFNLTSITVAPDNVRFYSLDGVLYDRNNNSLLAYPAGKADTDFSIPNGITTLENSSFNGSRNLEGISDSV